MRSANIVTWTLITVLASGLGLAAWKMLEFRDRLHQLTVNARWEEGLRDAGFFEDQVIVLFGDSQLAGWRVGPSFGMLPIKNRGIAGDRASRAIRRFSRDVLAERATLVVILIGINDLGHATEEPVESVAASVDRLVSLALEHEIEVILCSVLPLQSPYYRPHLAEQVLELNEWKSRRNDVTFVDFHSAMVDEEGRMNADYTDDGLHPNPRGYAVMTQMLQSYLSQHLAKRSREIPFSNNPR